MTLSFGDVSEALTTRSSDRTLGFELCGAQPGSCRYASGTPSGSDVILVGDGKPVTRVRYAWADAPIVNLFDRAGVPAGPFEIDVP